MILLNNYLQRHGCESDTSWHCWTTNFALGSININITNAMAYSSTIYLVYTNKYDITYHGSQASMWLTVHSEIFQLLGPMGATCGHWEHSEGGTWRLFNHMVTYLSFPYCNCKLVCAMCFKVSGPHCNYKNNTATWSTILNRKKNKNVAHHFGQPGTLGTQLTFKLLHVGLIHESINTLT